MKCIGGSVLVKTRKGWQKRKLWIPSSEAKDKYWLVYVVVDGWPRAMHKDGTMQETGHWRSIRWPDTHRQFYDASMYIWCVDLVIATKQRLGVI